MDVIQNEDELRELIQEYLEDENNNNQLRMYEITKLLAEWKESQEQK